MKLTNLEVQQLQEEIMAFSAETITLLAKFRVTELFYNTKEVLKPYHALREEIIKGISADGKIAQTIKDAEGKDISNPLFTKAVETLKPLNDTEVEVNFEKLPLSLIADLKTGNNYPYLFKFFDPTK